MGRLASYKIPRYFSIYDCSKGAFTQSITPTFTKRLRAFWNEAFLGDMSAPWGAHRVIYEGTGFRVKKLMLHAGGSTSLQRHLYRAELWYCMNGTGRARLGRRCVTLFPGQMLYVPRKALHRLENKGAESMAILEVQFGRTLQDEDVQRIEDQYGRAP